MSTILLFVTAKIPVDRVNTFLSECQTIPDIMPNSVYALIRDRNVLLDDIDYPGTEPPVEDFQSGFIGATDEEIWRTLGHYDIEESRRPRAKYLDRNTALVLDQASESSNTVKMLYKPQHGGKQAWRVDFRFVPAVTPDLDRSENEEIYLKPDMRDDNGVLDLQKIKDAIGYVWPPPELDAQKGGSRGGSLVV